MSSSFRSDSDYTVDIEELLQIGTMCRERLELDIKSLVEARAEDKKYIQKLERELSNCSQEIEHLQDQLNLRNIEELENKEMEIENSSLCVDQLEESISSIALESQCEIESMRIDLMALEQRCFEAKKFQEEAAHEKVMMDRLIEEFEIQFQEAQKMISCLEEENRELRGRLGTSESGASIPYQKVEENLGHWLENKYSSQAAFQSSCSKRESKLPASKQMSTCEEVLGPLLSKLAVVAASDEDLKAAMEKMLCQIHKSELLVKQLKEELIEEKCKAKEEAEDLTQEMAELRYQTRDMLEQECKRRACIEQASLQRIAELEAQLRKEQKKSFIAVRHFREAQKLAESRSMEVHRLQNVLEGLMVYPQTNEVCTCGDCLIFRSTSIGCLSQEPVEPQVSELDSAGHDILSRKAIAWHPEEIHGS
uniref:Uncharacterized protein n=1 Tax=Nelumbo nucifera TaxID=4432 RepID=A0A822YQB0_NELNU|nr:TPA_asm: hypothetical protein HUJ06_010269 [Nelumbo nucifera]